MLQTLKRITPRPVKRAVRALFPAKPPEEDSQPAVVPEDPPLW